MYVHLLRCSGGGITPSDPVLRLAGASSLTRKRCVGPSGGQLAAVDQKREAEGEAKLQDTLALTRRRISNTNRYK